MVDSSEMPIGVGESLSYLTDEAQGIIFNLIQYDGCKISIATAQELKQRCAHRDCTEQEIRDILSPTLLARPIQKPVKLSVPQTVYQKYFPAAKPKEAEKQLLEILEEYFSSRK